MKKIARKMKMKKKIFDRKQYECNDNSNLVSLNVNINVDNKNKFNIKDSELIKQDKLDIINHKNGIFKCSESDDYVSASDDSENYLPPKKILRQYNKWKTDEFILVRNYFMDYFKRKASKKLPNLKEIREFKKKNFICHSEKTIKTKIMNELNKSTNI